MFGTLAQREEPNGVVPRRRAYWITWAISNPRPSDITTSLPKKKATFSVKFEDMYGFTVEGNIDDVNVLNEVRERVRDQSRVWMDLEASKGADWYLQTNDGRMSVVSLKLSKLTNTITLKNLVRKGIPPTLRPKVWLAVSGAEKKRSTVPESYYDDLTKATEGKVTPATKQIDHDLPRTFPSHPWLDSPEGQASLRRVLVGYSFRDSDVGYCQTTLRVWDVLFNEGAKVLFHVALAIFKMEEEELLRARQIGEVIDMLQTATHHQYNPDELLMVAFEKIGSMTTNTITKERKKQEPAVMAVLDERLKRLNTLRDG